MINKKIEVETMPDGCMGHFIFGYSGCPYAKVDANPKNPGAYCQWDDKHNNLIMFVGERPQNCPLVQKSAK